MKPISSVIEFGDNAGKKIKELISEKSIPAKEKVLAYLKSFDPDCVAGMYLVDEVTGETIHSCVEGYEDSEFYWDTREIYHFEKYNLHLDEDFVEYVVNYADRFCPVVKKRIGSEVCYEMVMCLSGFFTPTSIPEVYFERNKETVRTCDACPFSNLE